MMIRENQRNKPLTRKKKKHEENYPNKNNPLYQIKVYNQEYLIRSKLNYNYQT